MVCKLLNAILLLAFVSYCSSVIVYLQKSYPGPRGSCETVDCQPSTHGGIHTYDCYGEYTSNNVKTKYTFYLLRKGGLQSNKYYVVTEEGDRTGKTATLKKKNGITTYDERDEVKGTRYMFCATDSRDPDLATEANLAKECKFKRMVDNNNSNC